MADEETAYVGAGGNAGGEGAVLARLAAAVEAIRGWPEVERIDVAPIYRTAPVGPVREQPAFLNTALRLRLRPEVMPAAVGASAGGEPPGVVVARRLLARLHAVERALGRDRARERPQGPRPIDLDLLLVGDATTGEAAGADQAGTPRGRVVQESERDVREADGRALALPHPRMAGRAFVLRPLVDLTGAAFVLPHTGRTVADHLAAPDVAAQAVELTSCSLPGGAGGGCCPGAGRR